MKYKVDIDKIEEFIKLKGWTKLEFCKQCGIRPSFYTKLAYNNFILTNKFIFQIANVMGVGVLSLFKV